MKREWLAALIESSYNARNVPQEEQPQEDYIEIAPDMLAELESDTFVSSKNNLLIISIGKNGRGVYLLQKKARNKREYVRRQKFEVVPGNQLNGMPSVKRIKPNLDISMIQPRQEAEEEDD